MYKSLCWFRIADIIFTNNDNPDLLLFEAKNIVELFIIFSWPMNQWQRKSEKDPQGGCWKDLVSFPWAHTSWSSKIGPIGAFNIFENNFYYLQFLAKPWAYTSLTYFRSYFMPPTVQSFDKLISDQNSQHRSDNYIIIVRYAGPKK